MAAALGSGRIPVFAPVSWLRRDDPLPHSWQVTSDSAAWVAGVVGASRLVLVKPPGSGNGPDVVNGYFARARANLVVDVIPADTLDTLRQVTRP